MFMRAGSVYLNFVWLKIHNISHMNKFLRFVNKYIIELLSVKFSSCTKARWLDGRTVSEKIMKGAKIKIGGQCKKNCCKISIGLLG